MGTIKCTAAGDAMMFRKIPGEYPGYKELTDFIKKGDFRFLNLETTIHRHETWGDALSGGSWFCAPPEILESVKEMGFNMLTSANNHALDYGVNGLFLTKEYIQKAGLQTCGTGKSLADAAEPIYLDTLQGRIALISGCSTFYPNAMAGEQTRTMIGRPGVNGIGFNTTYYITHEQMEQMKSIAGEIGINVSKDITRKEGYYPPLPEGEFEFGDYKFREAPEARKETKVKPADMERTIRYIQEAKFMADYIVISIHSHELSGTSKENPADFLVEFAHKCIDAGADAIVGTGPHLLRPIEIYKGCPIFYCLGDFFNELETIRKAPPGMFEKQNLNGNDFLDVMFNDRSANGTKGLYYERKMFETVVPYWEAEDGKLTHLELLPVELHFGEKRSTGGVPAPDRTKGIIERLAKMSEPYGTKITIDENGIGHVELS